jgi:Flp pilus assembly protein TadD
LTGDARQAADIDVARAQGAEPTATDDSGCDALTTLGLRAARAGQTERAVALFALADQAALTNRSAAAVWADCLTALGRGEEARRVRRIAQTLHAGGLAAT